jgi:protocatechuate 3,4-dioxygenase beta subunit
VQKRLTRRELIAIMGAAGSAAAWGCGTDSVTSPSADTSSSATGTSGTSPACAVTPTETVGPYPSRADIFRSDVREDRSGTPLTLNLKVVNSSANCAPVSGASVEIWHCDAAGDYSEYGAQTTATWLRGVQTTNATGDVAFTTVYPGWYQGRATHIHIDVTINGRSVKATQIAFPESINNTVYAQGVYARRGTNPMSNASDGIFADSLTSELVTPSGSPSTGYTANFQVNVTV